MDKQIEAFNEYFKGIVTDHIDRYGIPFATENYKYFYDTGTGKVLQCTESTYRLICNLFENRGRVNQELLNLNEEEFSCAVDELKDAIETEHIFKAQKFDRFICTQTTDLENRVGKACQQLILEVTEKCNLRCRYCIYGDETKNFRTFSTRDMTFETAKKAMDYALSIADDKMTLSFYGGEPLIQYQLMKDCTDYFKERYKGEKLSLVFTSNLTLLTKEMADYFSENKFMVTCSLDGDQESHNENRVYCGGTGSFDDTIRGLKLLVEAYGEDAKEHVAVNTVIDSPYSTEKFERINAFFHSLSWLPKDMIIRVSYAAKDRWSEDTELSANTDLMSNKMVLNDVFIEWLFDKVRKQDSKVFSDNLLKETLLDIHKRVITDEPIEDCILNGCCVPGIRRLYVRVDGKFSVCERIGCSPDIGNVDEGISLEKIKKYYVDDYAEKSLKNCSDCWAVQLCGVCYSRCFDENGLDMKRKKVLCENSRFVLYNALRRYHMLLEEYPEMLEEYNEIEFS